MSGDQLFAVPVQGVDSDERFTPQWIFDGLGLLFDTDPASPVEGGDCVPATRKITRLEDGLALRWQGRVWLNPPFSDATAWADKFRAHAHGVFLGPVANARWWFDLARRVDLLWHCRDFAFTHPTHAGRRSSMPLCMMAMGGECAEALDRLAHSGRHDGLLVVAKAKLDRYEAFVREVASGIPYPASTFDAARDLLAASSLRGAE